MQMTIDFSGKTVLVVGEAGESERRLPSPLPAAGPT